MFSIEIVESTREGGLLLLDIKCIFDLSSKIHQGQTKTLTPLSDGGEVQKEPVPSFIHGKIRKNKSPARLTMPCLMSAEGFNFLFTQLPC